MSKVRDLANALRKKSGGWQAFSNTEVYVDVVSDGLGWRRS
jgi:hypothetical protein